MSFKDSRLLNLANFSYPGKVFILGEYGILAGSRAVVATVSQKFQFAEGGNSFYAESPAGKWLSRFPKAPSLRCVDSTPAILSAGGFGASTAQFLAAYSLTSGEHDFASSAYLQKCWRDYREITGGKASGADLIAQAVGKPVLVQIKNVGIPSETIEWNTVDLQGIPVFIFSVAHQEGRKVATHLHLDQENQSLKDTNWIQDLDLIVTSGVHAIQNKDFIKIGKCFTDFSQALRNKNIELDKTAEDLTKLMQVKGVLGAKGCGALQADAIAVVYDPSDARNRDRILDFAKRRDWKFVTDFFT